MNPQLDETGRLRHLLSLEGLSVRLCDEIFSRAGEFMDEQGRRVIKRPLLRGKLVVNAIFEPSTRTRLSFEIAAKSLGADLVNFGSAGSSAAKGESYIDTVRNIVALGADLIIVRHSQPGAAHRIASETPPGVAVINGGDGCHAHPSQGLLDAWTVLRARGSLRGLKVAVIGDILHSRVARSLAHIFTALGAGEVVACGPPTMMPARTDCLGMRIEHNADAAVASADIIVVLRMQIERMAGSFYPSQEAYHRDYGIDTRRLRLAAPDVLLLHPGPINRGVELSGAAADGPRSLILAQVTNGIAIRMAVMSMLCTRKM